MNEKGLWILWNGHAISPTGRDCAYAAWAFQFYHGNSFVEWWGTLTDLMLAGY